MLIITMESPTVAKSAPAEREREGTVIDPRERDQLRRLLNIIEKDKINLGDVKVHMQKFFFMIFKKVKLFSLTL